MARFAHKPAIEWGSKARKEEEDLRGLNASDRRAAIAEQLDGLDGRVTMFSCPEHAPAGITPEPSDDGRPTCSICGRSTYAVKPYRVTAFVVERGYWRTANGAQADISI